MPYAISFWALAFPSVADLFDVQPACHVIGDNHIKFNLKFYKSGIAWKAILLGLRIAPDHREEPRCILDEGEDALG